MFSEQKLIKAMEALKNGDDSSFDVIYDQTNRLVYYVIYSILKNHHQSEDVMQDVYMKVCEKISSYTNSPKAWISTIARNLAINQYNKNKKEVSDFDFDKISTTRPETPLIDLAAKILPEDEFTITMLCVCEGYKRREVAKIVNLSTSGVTWKLDNALKKLKKEVQK